jgi:putative ABC transport system permease protein
MGPTVPVALAHPLASPVRTAVVMAMFSITVFSVVVLSGYTEQFDNYSSSFVEETEGEFELMLTSSRSRPIELASNPANWNISSSLVDDIDATGLVYRSEVFLEDSNQERMPYILRGYDSGFANHGGLPLFEWDSQYGDTESEVWNTVRTRQDLVLLDASFGLELATDGTGVSVLSFSIGDSIFLIDLSNPGNKRMVTVAGFLEQSSYLFSPGVWMSDEIVEDQFDGRLTRMYVSLTDSATASSDFDDSGISTFSATGKPSNVRIAAAQLAQDLEQELNSEGVNVSIISDDVMLIQSLVVAILGIFEAYLALGLIVGIGGIGVVTVRSVSERRKTIGILRALGYRKSMVMLSFLIEVSWVAVLGILNGVIIAVGFHRALYVAFWEEQGAAFSLPWSTILMVVLGGWILVLLATMVPIRKATRVPPSAALREI